MAQSNGFLPYWGAGFDPSQDENPYSLYKNAAFPRKPSFSGPATDAKGNVIQSYADAAKQAALYSPIGTGLATTSAPPQQGLGGSEAERQLAGWGALDPIDISPNSLQGLDRSFGSSMATQPLGTRMQNAQSGNIAANMPTSLGGTLGSTANATAAQAAQPQPVDMSQAYLDALSNPGKVTTPGAQVAQGPLPAQQGNELDQFITNWKKNPGATQGAGGYSNLPFLSGIGAA